MKYDPVKAMDFAKVISRKGMKGSDLELGETVLVSSLRVAPEKESDPYLQRVYALVVKLDEKGYPRTTDNDKIILVDPRKLEKLAEKEQKEAFEKVKEKYEGSY